MLGPLAVVRNPDDNSPLLNPDIEKRRLRAIEDETVSRIAACALFVEPGNVAHAPPGKPLNAGAIRHALRAAFRAGTAALAQSKEALVREPYRKAI